MVDLPEVASNLAVDAVAKPRPGQATSIDVSVGASAQPAASSAGDAVRISAEGQRTADALSNTDALAAGLDDLATLSTDPADVGVDTGFNTGSDQAGADLVSTVAAVDQTVNAAADRAGQVRTAIDGLPLEARVDERNSVVNGALRVDATEPVGGPDQDFLATNQRASVDIDRAGNDGLSQTEASRTLGQVVDVFA